MMKKIGIVLITIIVILLVGFGVAYAIPSSRESINEYFFRLEQVDQETDYENRKMVEDTARAMITNYKVYEWEYNTYRVFDVGTDEYQRAIDAKLQANRIASSYNNYITQNSFVWSGNLPDDIPPTLPLIE